MSRDSSNQTRAAGGLQDTPVALGHLRDLAAALGLLTRLPLRQPAPGGEAFARATIFFPLVGLGIGAVLLAVNWLVMGHLRAWVAAVVLVACWEGLSRPPRLCGAATETDQSRARCESRARWMMRALSGGLIAAKICCLSLRIGSRPAALLFAPMLGRWSMVVLAVGARDAHDPGRKFNPALTFREFALTSVFSCAALLTVAEAVGLLIMVCVAGMSLAGRVLTHRWTGGTTWRMLDTSARAIEVVVLFLWAVL